MYFLTINLFQLQQEHLGDLLVSMMYQPTNNRIVVVVMKAAKLKKMDLIGSCGKIFSLFKNLTSVTLVTLSLLQSITEPATIVLTFGAVNKQLCCTHLNETSFISHYGAIWFLEKNFI